MKVVLLVLLSLLALGCLAQECSQDTDCQETEFCNRDYSCGAEVGACMTIPEICMEIYQPVCGCDGLTHGNPCSAYSVGVSIDTDGECEYFVALDDGDSSFFTDLLETGSAETGSVETGSAETDDSDEVDTHEKRSHESHKSRHSHHHSRHEDSGVSMMTISLVVVFVAALLF